MGGQLTVAGRAPASYIFEDVLAWIADAIGYGCDQFSVTAPAAAEYPSTATR